MSGSHRRFWLGAAACAGFLLTLLWSGVAMHLAFDRVQTTYQASLNVANLSQVVDEHLAHRIYEIDQALLAAKNEYERYPGVTDPAAVIGRSLGLQGATASIQFIDAAGYALASDAPAGGTGRVYWGDREAFTAHFGSAGDRLFIGKPTQISRNGDEHWGIPLSRRLDHADGSLAGVVLVTVRPEFLSAVFDKLNIGQDGFIAVVGRDDFVIRACTTQAGVSVPRLDLKNSPLPIALAQASAGAFSDASPVDGTPRIIGYRALTDYPLIVAIGASRAEILAPYNARRAWLITAAGAISIVIISIAALLARQNTRRLRAETELNRQADELRISRREAERANASAQAADRAKSEFLANMSHELRTPLNAIIGFSEVMSTGIFGPVTDRYRDYAQSINNAGNHLLKILNDILDLSKIEAGRFELHEEEVAIGELFDDCRRILAERATTAGLALVFKSTDLALRADPLRLRQMMLNLLSNAIKFTPSGGQVTAIADLTASGGVTISVRDTGIGLKAEDIPRALEPFGQVDNATTRSQEGTGLGLPLVRRLVELHDGRMVLESSPGHGTTVALTFPAARTAQPHRRNAAA